ncbi:MAG: fumarate hydratase, partial [Chloroflexota bacterium]
MARLAIRENTSRLRMFPPSVSWEGIAQFVVESVADAGPNSCPPLVVGVGAGGEFEYALYLAKKALLRRTGESHPDPEI